MGQRVAITGSSGLIGSALSSSLRERGDEVVHLVRRPARAPHEVTWDPAAHDLDAAALGGVTAVVNLAGAGVGDHRWTPAYRRTLVRSRLDSTRTVAAVLARLGRPVRLVSGSAMGVYGDRGEERLTESSAPGSGFLPDLVVDWEAAAGAAVDAGCPTAFLRTSLVLAPAGGMMQQLLPLARLGLNGPLGSGRQWWAWITLEDTVRVVLHLLDRPEITGPVHVATADPRRQKDFAAALGAVLHRPSFLPAPRLALQAALGGMSEEVMSSRRLVPGVLEQSGFAWRHAALEDALQHLVRP